MSLDVETWTASRCVKTAALLRTARLLMRGEVFVPSVGVGPVMTRVALIGLGEVGRVFAEDLAAGGVTDLVGLGHRVRRSGLGRLAQRSDLLGRWPRRNAADAVTRRRPRRQRRDGGALRSPRPPRVRRGLAEGTWFFDLNSSSPGAEAGVGARSSRAPAARYVEAALMSPIAPRRLASPFLLGGPHAADFVAAAGDLGTRRRHGVLHRGRASAAAAKLCRSVIVKGLESLLSESLLAARSYGVEKDVLDSLSNILPPADWEAVAGYFMTRSLQHGAPPQRGDARGRGDRGRRRASSPYGEGHGAAAERGRLSTPTPSPSPTCSPSSTASARRATTHPRGRPAGPVIIDCHGHYTTAPGRAQRLARGPARRVRRRARGSAVSRASPTTRSARRIEQNQLRLLRERGTDLTIFSPRASAMAHHVGDEAVSIALVASTATT